MEGFGGSGDSSDDEEDEAEVILPHPEEAGERFSEPVAIGLLEAIPRDNGEEETDAFAREDEALLSSRSKPGVPLRRMSSPIGLRESPGPGGNRLSNGLGHSRNGFGAGGTSYH